MTGTTFVQKIIKSVQKITEDSQKEMCAQLVSELELTSEQQEKMHSIVHSSFNFQDSGKTLMKKKRSPTAYNLFMRDNIIKLKKEFPDIEKTELMRKSAALWQLEKLKPKL
tara:strand:+ start:1318 stop:1650 length:333 start_codon:yes stop_codon:yes gene_type:complete